MYVNPHDSNGSAEIGNDASNRFEYMARKLLWQTKPSTKEQDMFDHFDYVIEQDLPDDKSYSYKVDVKARKRIARHGDFIDDKIWIELQGVNHSRGWLFGGKADLLAFEFKEGFWFARRTDIIDFVCTLSMKSVSKPTEALYNAYTRRGRGDRVTMIRKDDIPYAMIWRDYSQETNLEKGSLKETDTSASSATPQLSTRITSLKDASSHETSAVIILEMGHPFAPRTISKPRKPYSVATKSDVPLE